MHSQMKRANLPLKKRVTEGDRTRDLRSHNPSAHIRVRADRSQYVAKVSEKVTVRSAGGPVVSGCVLLSIAATLLPLLRPVVVDTGPSDPRFGLSAYASLV